MSILRNLGLTALCLMFSFSLSADFAEAKPKHKSGKWKNDKHQERHHEKRYGSFDDDCDFYPPGLRKQGKVPHGLAKQGKVPPGWTKKCRRGRGGDRRHHRPIHAHDRRNQDPGYHVPEHQRKHSPCEAVSGKARDIVVGTTMGAGIGGIIGSGTGDTEAGVIFGGVVGGIIGAAAGDGDKDPCK